MFILLNNIFTNTLDILRISPVYKVGPTEHFPRVKEEYLFLVEIKDRRKVISKNYETEDEAIESLKELLLKINTTIAELPVINI